MGYFIPKEFVFRNSFMLLAIFRLHEAIGIVEGGVFNSGRIQNPT